jgi:tripartite-type tricarboxylate transporter receptor subunit TctC
MITFSTKNTNFSKILCFLILLTSNICFADDFPTKSVTIIVPFSAGGPTDAVARLLAVPMGKYLGQPVLVENTVGAGGTLAASKVAKSQKDGYTLLLHHIGISTAPALYAKLNYDTLNDFEYIGEVVNVPMTIIGSKNFAPNNFQELLAYLQKNKDKVTLANAGPGAVSQLCGLLFTSQLGIPLTQVPYKGTGPAITDLLGGQVDLLCDQTTNTLTYIRSDKVKLFGVTTQKRLPSLPNTPTISEQGLKGFEIVAWHGLYTAKGTPSAALDKLNKALRAALIDPDVKARLLDLNVEIARSDEQTPAALKAKVESEVKKWAPIIKAAGGYIE